MLVEKIILHLNVFIHGRHNISDFEPDTSHFDQVLLHQTVAGNLKLRAPCLTHNPPYFLFRLPFENLVNVIVYEVFMVYPVATVLMQQASNYLISVLFI